MAAALRVRAVNTAADSENRIHDDRIAAEYGFRRGLVPGVTIYGYMASAAIAKLGQEWLEFGAMDVRFFEPYYDGEEVEVSAADQGNRLIKVNAAARATGLAWIKDAPGTTDYPPEQPAPAQVSPSRETIRTGIVLGTIEKTLNLFEPGVSAPLDPWIGPARHAHPAILLALANEILMRNYALGPWIHSSSEVRNSSAARDGEQLQVRGKIVDAYERKGHEFAVLDVAILSGARLVSRIRHTVIWQLRKR